MFHFLRPRYTNVPSHSNSALQLIPERPPKCDGCGGSTTLPAEPASSESVMRLWIVALFAVCACIGLWSDARLPYARDEEKAAANSGIERSRSKLSSSLCGGGELERGEDRSDSKGRARFGSKFDGGGIGTNFESCGSDGAEGESGGGGESTGRKDRACGVAVFQGRRPSQEDRTICMSQISLPSTGGEKFNISIYAVFDGHGGSEASTFAAEVFYQHLLLHFTQILESGLLTPRTDTKTRLEGRDQNNEAVTETDGSGASSKGRNEKDYVGDLACNPTNEIPPSRNEKYQSGSVSEERQSSFTGGGLGDVPTRQALEEALSRSIKSIDTIFSREAKEVGLRSGTTACVVIQAEADLLVANLGDSKAFLCEPSDEVTCGLQGNHRRIRKKQGPEGSCKGGLQTTDLTSDHRPDKVDERLRIEASGGFVSNSGDVPRVNGRLAVSRSIGDVDLREYGVIAEPEFTGWLKIPSNKSLLVIASDGVFEQMTTQTVCEVLHAVQNNVDAAIVLGLESSRNSLPIAMPPSNKQALPDDGKEQFNRWATENSSFLPHDNEVRWNVSKNGKKNSLCAVSEPHEEVGDSGRRKLTYREDLGVVQSMAQAVGEAALELGSMDNIATIVIALEASPSVWSSPTSISPTTADLEQLDRSTAQSNAKRQTALKIIPEAATVTSNESDSKVWSKSYTQIVPNQTRVMIHSLESLYCYELIETMPKHMILPLHTIVEDETFHAEMLLQREAFWMPKAESDYGPGSIRVIGVPGSLEVYRDHFVCTPDESQHDEEIKGVCVRPAGLSHFLALIGSVPLDRHSLSLDSDVMVGFADSAMFVPAGIHYHRYMLKRNFARGAFGEVWLAVRRARAGYRGSDNSEFHWMNSASYNSCSTEGEKAHSQTTSKQSSSPKHDRTTYVLKRILVERGHHVYLSGLREKHFGEVFLNACTARVRPSKFSKTFSCPLSNPFSYPKPGFCPRWQNSSCSTVEQQNMGRAACQAHQNESLLGSHFEPNTSEHEQGDEHIVRYVESFEVIEPRELWLVFKNEGKSLSSLLYSSEEPEVKLNMGGGDGVFTVVQPSPWWHWLKTTPAGCKEMRNILRQLLLAVKSCHSRDITHRDIKPENMIVHGRGLQGVAGLGGGPSNDYPSNLKMRLIDFGSAIDPFTLKHMYGPSGPSRAEQTVEYAPPEALLGKHWLHFHADRTYAYDLWSVGVVMLELVLGTPHVFQISPRTRALLDRRLQGWDEPAKETAYMLRAFLELCILLPGTPPQNQFHHRREAPEHMHTEEVRLASGECTEEAFMHQMKQRDPLGIGMPDKWALRLVRRLLQWYPEDRISARDALKHAYFHPKLQSD